MRLNDLTLIYCPDDAEWGEIQNALRRYNVQDGRYAARFAGVGFGDLNSATVALRQAEGDYNKNALRAIFIVDDAASMDKLTDFVAVLRGAMDEKRILFNTCRINIIWRTDSTRMSDGWQLLKRAYETAYAGAESNNGIQRLLIRLMLVSQQTDTGGILRGIDAETAALLTVMSACGLLDGNQTGVYMYETHQLSLMDEDVRDIIESESIRALIALHDETKDTDAKDAYCSQLWAELFGDWDEPRSGARRLRDISLERKIGELMPQPADICVFAPDNYGEISAAINFFMANNRDAISGTLPRRLADDWRRHADALLERRPDMINYDLVAYLRELAGEVLGSRPAASQSAAFSEPEPGKLVKLSKKKLAEFYMSRLIERANGALGALKPCIRHDVLTLIQRECSGLADEVEARIRQRTALIDKARRYRRLSRQDVERFNGIAEDIVQNIRANIANNVTRSTMAGYAREKALRDTAADIRAYLDDIAAKSQPDRDRRNLIAKINSMELIEIRNNPSQIALNGRLLRCGKAVTAAAKPDDSYCFISDAIQDGQRINAIVESKGISRNHAISVHGFDNIVIVNEYALSVAQRREYDADGNPLTPSESEIRDEAVEVEHTLCALDAWNQQPLLDIESNINAGQDDNAQEAVAPHTEDTVSATDAPQFLCETVTSGWRFTFPWADDADKNYVISVSIIGKSDDGRKNIPLNRTGNVGRSYGNSFVVDNTQLYGRCEAAVKSVRLSSEQRLTLSGKKIECDCRMKRRGKALSPNSTLQLEQYDITLERHSGSGSPAIVENEVKLAAAFGDSALAYYVGSGHGKNGGLTLYLPQDKARTFRLVPADAEQRELYSINIIERN